jgi:two-component system, NarL family, nitrate/nitrite response regulator NarL
MVMAEPLRAEHPLATESSPALRLVILDDVKLYRDGLRSILAPCPGLVVVGEGAADRDGLRLATALGPDVLLLVASAVLGTTLVAELARLAPDVRVLAYGVSASDEEAIRCAEAGVAGYIPRDAPSSELVATILSVSHGEFVCSPRVAALLLRRVAALAAGVQAGRETEIVLTPREREVGELLNDGLSNKEIAVRLGIGVSTVKNHVHHVLAKLQVSGRGLAAAHIRRARI